MQFIFNKYDNIIYNKKKIINLVFGLFFKKVEILKKLGQKKDVLGQTRTNLFNTRTFFEY